MADISSLMSRIDAEFAIVETHMKNIREHEVKEYEGRRQRLGQLDKVFEQLREVWRPKLEALADKFGDKVKITPRLTPLSKDATFAFQSKLAQIDLRFGATTDFEVRKVILTYDLDILPIFMKFDSHAEIEFPIDKVDLQAAGEWIDDRIISFVKTFLALHEHDQYLKDAMVEDPVAGVRFPKFAAATSLEHGGKTYYFIGNETRLEFEKQKGLATN